MVGQSLVRRSWRRFVHVHDRRRTRSSRCAHPSRHRPLAVRAAARALGRRRTQTIPDQPGRGRAAAVPAFVGPVLAAHIDEFGRYPMNKGLEAFCEVAANCEPVYLPATAETGFLPDLDALSDELLGRTVAFFIASPANPQGAVADLDYLKRVVALARRFGFLVFSDECYSEIYTRRAPAGMLEAAGPDLANVVEFQSLSKRSNLPGLRVGFAAGDRTFLARFLELRNVSAPQVPVPAQRVAIAAYGDEAHVVENRRLYAQKFDLADQIIGDRYGYRRPAGGFFLWLDVSAHGSDEAVTLRLWREAGLRVVPGRYLAREQPDGSNPGLGFVRVAIVQDRDTTTEALHRLVALLG